MSVGPRIVFTRFPSRDSVRLRPWREHQARVVGSEPEVVDVPAPIAWTLSSANNRELGRGGRLFARFDEAVDGAKRTTSLCDELEVQLISDRWLGGFGWYLSHADRAELVCSRWYESERDRRHAIDVALESLRSATLQPGARLLRASEVTRTFQERS